MLMLSIRLSSLRSLAMASAEVRPSMGSSPYVVPEGVVVVVPPVISFFSVTESFFSPPISISSAPFL